MYIAFASAVVSVSLWLVTLVFLEIGFVVGQFLSEKGYFLLRFFFVEVE